MRETEPSDPKVAAVVEAAAAHGVTIAPVRFEGETRTSQDAADQIGCEVARICKSLVFQDGDEPVLLLMSGSDRVDLDRAASAVGAERLARADADLAKRFTGYSIGATPPFGHAQQMRVYVDRALVELGRVWAAGGRTDTVFEIDAGDLVTIAGATVADLRERRS